MCVFVHTVHISVCVYIKSKTMIVSIVPLIIIQIISADPKVPIEKLRFTMRGGARVAEQMVHLLRNEEKDLVIKRLKKVFTFWGKVT